MRNSQYHRCQGHTKDGHRILYSDYFIPTEVFIHVMLGAGAYVVHFCIAWITY